MVRIISIPDWLFQQTVVDDAKLLVLGQLIEPNEEGTVQTLLEVRHSLKDGLHGKVDFS